LIAVARDNSETFITPLDRIYEILAPFLFGPLWLVACAATLSRDERRERTGLMPSVAGPVVWFHGASAGEMAAALKLSAVLQEAGFQFTAAFTTTNRAGVEYVWRATSGKATVALAPWDVRRWISHAFEEWQPAALVLVETELWPQLILEAARRRIPVFSVNARIYPRDFSRYRAIRRFMTPVLSRLTKILAQNETERERFVQLGATAEQSIVAGNLKHLVERAPAGQCLELALSPSEKLVVFGSIHADEIEFVIAAIDGLRSLGTRIIIAPRHLKDVPALVASLRKAGWSVARRTCLDCSKRWDLMVLDTIGELSGIYARASIAVVGGGFGRHGGHNPFEPVLAGAPVMFGNHFEHFEDESGMLGAAAAQARAGSSAELAELLARWLSDDKERLRILEVQRRVIPSRDEIVRNYVEALKPWLLPVSPRI